MNAYLLSFSDDLGTREAVKNALNQTTGVIQWRYDMTNAFYFTSNLSAEELYVNFKSNINSDGKFIITQITPNTQGWITEDSWFLINNKKLNKV